MEPTESKKTENPSKDGNLTKPVASTILPSANPTAPSIQNPAKPAPAKFKMKTATGKTTPNKTQVPATKKSQGATQVKPKVKTNISTVAGSQKPGISAKSGKPQKVVAMSGKQTTTHTINSSSSTNSGNDRVTVDKSHEPLIRTNQSAHPNIGSKTIQLAPKNVASTTLKAKSTVKSSVAASKSPILNPTIKGLPTSQEAKTKIQTGGSAISHAIASSIKTAPFKPPPSGVIVSTPSSHGKSKQDSSPPKNAVPIPGPPLDEQSIIDEAIRKKRAPLTDRYGQFIINSDTTLEDARLRLRTAIEQTRQLRAAFTERVYGKYRVCLRPPSSTEQVLTELLADPAYCSHYLNREIKDLKEEKDAEKKEAQKLNAEMMAASSSGEGNPLSAMNAENAEQLMYISAGLSLIILPEQDVSNINMGTYTDRAPINPETGQRVRSISAAAAAAGEVMLDRARKGAAMRAERRRRRQLKLMSGEDPESSVDNNYSRLSLLSNSTTAPATPIPKPAVKVAPAAQPAAPSSSSPPPIKVTPTPILISKSTKKTPIPKPPPQTPSPANAKAIRARVQQSMSTQTLLSIHPSAEELRIDGKTSASTMVLLERGVGTQSSSSKQNQQRYRHPFPDSHGARSPTVNTNLPRKDSVPINPYIHPAFLSMGLPPLPTPKDKRTYKKINVLNSSRAGSHRARTAVRAVLNHFVSNGGSDATTEKLDISRSAQHQSKKRRISEIGLMHAIRISDDENNEGKPEQGTHYQPNGPQGDKKSLDPILALNVLQSIGIIEASWKDSGSKIQNLESTFDESVFDIAEKRAMGEEGGQSRRSIGKLRSLCKKFKSNKRTFVEAFVEPHNEGEWSSPRRAERGIVREEGSEKDTNTGDNTSQPPIVSIRGGGDALMDSSDRSKTGVQAQGGGQQVRNGGHINADPTMNAQQQNGAPQRTLNNTLSTNDLGSRRMMWDEGSRQPLVLLNSQLARPDQGYPMSNAGHQTHLIQHPNGAANVQRNPRMHSRLQSSEHYHHQTTNAIQLAHHLRHATASIQRIPPHRHPSAGDLEAYIGGLHPTPANAYDWSNMNAANAAAANAAAANAAAVASTQSLAALGLNPHRAAMVNFSVQDRARVILAREQQTAAAQAAAAAHAAAAHRQQQQALSSQQAVAFLGTGHGYPSNPNSHFQHMGGPAATAALLNSPAAIMGHSGMPQVQKTSQGGTNPRVQHVNSDGRNANLKVTDQSSKKGASPSRGNKSEPPKKKDISDKEENKKESSKKATSQKPDSSSVPKSTLNNQDSQINRKRKLAENDGQGSNLPKKANNTSKITKHEEPIASGPKSDKEAKTTKVFVESKTPSVVSKPNIVERNADKEVDKLMATEGAKKTDPSPIKSDTNSKGKKDPGNPTPTQASIETQKLALHPSTTEKGKIGQKPLVGLNQPKPVPTPTLPKSSASDSSSIHKKAQNISKLTGMKALTSAQKNASATVSPKPTALSRPQQLQVETKAENRPPASLKAKGGLQFFVPPAPLGIPSEVASLVLAAKFHEAIEFMGNSEVPTDAVALVDYMVAVGTAVPIPKALVSATLKDRMQSSFAKISSLSSIPALCREVIIASILLWLWKNHEDTFQCAFGKSGRIDVDPQCKWLVHAAADTSARALAKEMTGTTNRSTSPLSVALSAFKNKGASLPKGFGSTEIDRMQATTNKLDLVSASIVNKALAAGYIVNDQSDSVVPLFHDMLSYLDECRKCALYSKCQERALLAALISRKATMSLPFSHAYASSMVRAGEALGHGELFEVVQNEEVNVSTMIPYDVFTDESGAWEDPCRPIEGFTQNVTGDDLMRRAHARAMIQKSLKKLQDRHSIKGGAPNPGPYTDPPSSGSSTNADSSRNHSGSNSSSTPRGWLKRRSSFAEPPVQPGTGSAVATSWNLYDPKHYSSPLLWKSDDIENGPYGSYNQSSRPRSASLAQGLSNSKQSGGRSRSKGASGRASAQSSSTKQGKSESTSGMLQSTKEIPWVDVANIFEQVKLPRMSKEQKAKEAHASVPRKGTIFAPFVRQVELSLEGSDSDSDSEEEDLRDESVLARHQIVLDEMKEKLSAVLEARKKTQDRRKSRDKTK